MKKMKAFFAMLCAAVCLLLFAGCGKKGAALTGSMTVVIRTQEQDTVLNVELSDFCEGDSVMTVLDALAENKKLCYKGTKGVYGIYLTAIGVPQESTMNGTAVLTDRFLLEESLAEKRSVYVYTSVTCDQAEGSYVTTLTYGDTTLTESMQGVSKMTVCDGAVICFAYLYWG